MGIVEAVAGCRCFKAQREWSVSASSPPLPSPPPAAPLATGNLQLLRCPWHAYATLPLYKSAADDQDAVMGGDWHMPKLRRHLANEGINLTSYITNFGGLHLDVLGCLVAGMQRIHLLACVHHPGRPGRLHLTVALDGCTCALSNPSPAARPPSPACARSAVLPLPLHHPGWPVLAQLRGEAARCCLHACSMRKGLCGDLVGSGALAHE